MEFIAFAETLLDQNNVNPNNNNISVEQYVHILNEISLIPLPETIKTMLQPAMQTVLPFVVTPRVFGYRSLNQILNYHQHNEDKKLASDMQTFFSQEYARDLNRTSDCLYHNMNIIFQTFPSSNGYSAEEYTLFKEDLAQKQVTREQVQWFNKHARDFLICCGERDFKYTINQAHRAVCDHFSLELRDVQSKRDKAKLTMQKNYQS